MPVKSKAQFKLMAGIAHGTLPERDGLTKKVAKEYIKATPKGKFKKLKEKIGKK